MTNARKNKIRSVKFLSKRILTINGFILGTLFQIVAWSFYLLADEYSFSLSGISNIHINNPVNYIIDAAPLVLGLIFYFIADALRDLAFIT